MAKKLPSLPAAFLNRLPDIFGTYYAREIQKTFIERPTTFRANTLKSTRLQIIAELQAAGFKVNNVSWYKDAFILKNKSLRELQALPMYMEGRIYVQSLASMVPPLVLEPKPGETVLDLTAAPGSKTSEIAALMEGVGELVANDNNEIRFARLAHNMDLLGVTTEREKWKFKLQLSHGTSLVKDCQNYFDKILLDAPCSAEARFIMGDSSTYGFWNERHLKEMAYKQRQLLLAAWGALKPGGMLVYSTCTFAPEENELQIQKILERFSDARVESIKIGDLKAATPINVWQGIALLKQISKGLRILPTAEIEGFYVAKIKKALPDK